MLELVPSDLTVTRNSNGLSAGGYHLNTFFSKEAPMQSHAVGQAGGGSGVKDVFSLEGISSHLAVPAGLSYIQNILQEQSHHSHVEDMDVAPDALIDKLMNLVNVSEKRTKTRRRQPKKKKNTKKTTKKNTKKNTKKR
jgi:hypothetical protein